MADGVNALSHSASLLQKINAASGCLYQIVLNQQWLGQWRELLLLHSSLSTPRWYMWEAEV